MQLRLSLLILLTATPASASTACTFSDWAWHSASGKAANYQDVVTTKERLSPQQKHPDLDCSVCREDQVEIKVEGAPPVTVCHAMAEDVRGALTRMMDAGFKVKTLTGYRVGRTKGPLDAQGLRTQYSHHSFGVAIDINAGQNGLYDRCVEFSPNCRLIRGGAWRPGQPGSITPGDPAYEEMRAMGLRWGGELAGRQKDFMHFSLGGD